MKTHLHSIATTTALALALLTLSALQPFSPSAFSSPASALPVYLDDSQPLDSRIQDALSRMTLEEKIAMVHAQSKFSSPGVPRLGIPENWMTDGPHGIKAEFLWDQWNTAGWTNDAATAFPALIALAATWNPDMAALYGKSIGEEARYRNKNVLLGPGVNISRTPLNGRNFEYLGEDPFLASRIVVPYIQAVQSNGVAACVKHFALNNQEAGRHTVDVRLSDRALREIYLPAFRAAVQEGRAWAIMGSFNLYNGQHCCHNDTLLKKILRDEWRFDGVVISDWSGAVDTMQSITNGLDLEFGTNTNGLDQNRTDTSYDDYHLAKPYLALIKSGQVPVSTLDAKVRNILRLSFRTTMNRNRPYGSFATPEHADASRRIAEEGIVLLKNAPVPNVTGASSSHAILPIDPAKTKKILVVGENAIRMMTIGGGSTSVKAAREILPLDALKARLAGAATITYARGYASGDDNPSQNKITPKQNLADKRPPEQLIAEATAAARDADIVITIGGLNKNHGNDSEGTDRANMDLPYGQNALISALARANKNLVVVLISGNPVTMPWANEVPAIVQAWYLGGEAGNALAAILTGDVNPSGKLPVTFPAKLADVGAHATNSYIRDGVEEYKEGIFVGYRWTEKNNIKPLFAFGHGLSYTTFEYGKLTLDKPALPRAPDNAISAITVTIPVKNTGARRGAEVVQLYISELAPVVPRPLKELKGFVKLDLAPNEQKTATFTITPDQLQYYDDNHQQWTSTPGKFELLIGSASDDIRAKAAFELLP